MVRFYYLDASSKNYKILFVIHGSRAERFMLDKENRLGWVPTNPTYVREVVMDCDGYVELTAEQAIVLEGFACPMLENLYKEATGGPV